MKIYKYVLPEVPLEATLDFVVDDKYMYISSERNCFIFNYFLSQSMTYEQYMKEHLRIHDCILEEL